MLNPLYIFFQTSKKGCTEQSIHSVQLQLQMPTRLHVNQIGVGLGSYLEKGAKSFYTDFAVSFCIFIYLFIYNPWNTCLSSQQERKKSRNITIDLWVCLSHSIFQPGPLSLSFFILAMIRKIIQNFRSNAHTPQKIRESKCIINADIVPYCT